MPSDPEHRLDKPLRAYARKRREDAGEPVLHPATRRVLQTEVARLRSQRGSARRALWSWVAWPRLAFAAAVCVALGVLLWNVLPDRPGTPSSQTLARLNQAEVEKEKAKSLGGEIALGLRADDKLMLGRSNKDETLKEQPAPPQPRFREAEDQLNGPAGATRDVRLARTLAEPAPASRPVPNPPRGAAPESDRGRVQSLRAEAKFGQGNLGKSLALDDAKQSESDAYGVTLAPKPASPQISSATSQLFESVGKPGAPAEGLSAVSERYYRRETVTSGALPAVPGRAPLAAPAAVPPATVPLPASAPLLAGKETEARVVVPAPQQTLAFTAESVPMKSQSGVVTLTQAQQRLRYQRREAAGVTVAARRGGVATPLAYFDFEQSGERVRLIDADGSVYEGSTSATNAAAFRVFGTNRASGKPLTVDGEFVAESATGAFGGGGATTRFDVNSRGQRATPPAATGAGAPPSTSGVVSSVGRALYLHIRPEGVAETRSLAVPAAK